jgi:anti-sigma regulatory factor (Ser/Thr protein kinase)
LTHGATGQGPGITNIPKVMMNGYSTSGGFGLDLPGVKQIADNFCISSAIRHGVQDEVTMWLVNKQKYFILDVCAMSNRVSLF